MAFIDGTLTASRVAGLEQSTAVVLGNIANQPLMGDTRAEQQADLARLERYNDAATRFAIAGSILTATAVGALIWWLRSDEETRP